MERIRLRRVRGLQREELEARNLWAVLDFIQTAAVEIAEPKNAVEAHAVTADLDGDGDLDLLVNNGWVPNRGGTALFEALRVISVGHQGQQIAGDIDGDGDLDVVAAGDAGHPLQWLPNESGSGDFGLGHAIGIEDTVATRIHLADLDRDGDLDLITGQPDSARTTYAFWYENLDGRGSFSTAIQLSSDAFTPLAAYDWNHDGLVDVLGNGPEELQLLYNDSKQAFSTHATLVEFTVNELDIADVDRDGDDDIVSVENTYDLFSGETSSRIWLHTNPGSNKLVATRVAEERGQLALGYNRSFVSVQVADINDDGQVDILTAFSSRVDHESNDSGGVVWFAGLDTGFDSSGRELANGELEMPSLTGIPAFAGAADFDRDGDNDVFSVWLQDQVNTAEGTETHPAYVRIDQARGASVLPGDIDGNALLGAFDIDTLRASLAFGDLRLDLNHDNVLDEQDVDDLMANYLQVVPGDANLDGIFDSGDLVAIFQLGQYEDAYANNSGWQGGDFDGDGEFTSQDLVYALANNVYVP